MKIYDLIQNNGRKSFYGKAKVVINEDNEQLFSYNTLILTRYNNGKIIRHYDEWTSATGSHIRTFCGLNKQEFFKLPLE